jgi:hypothetical protein
METVLKVINQNNSLSKDQLKINKINIYEGGENTKIIILFIYNTTKEDKKD